MVSRKKTLSDASMAAARLHAHLHTDLSKPIDVFQVVQDLGIWITTQPLGHLYGFYLRQDEALGICLNSSHPEMLQRYTCAHELAHHVLGHGNILDDKDDVDNWSGATSLEEQAAQLFAGNFLMPLGLVNRVMRKLGLHGQVLDAAGIYEISREMDVSFSAATWKLRSLNRIDDETAQRVIRAGAAAAKLSLRDGPPISSARAGLWTIHENSVPAEFTCRVGDEILIELHENRSTGRIWTIEGAVKQESTVAAAPVVKWDGGTGLELDPDSPDLDRTNHPTNSLRIADDRHIDQSDVVTSNQGDSSSLEAPLDQEIDPEAWLRESLGVDGLRKIAVVADGTGTYPIRMVLSPSWSEDDEPMSTLEVVVDVRPAHQLHGFSPKQMAAHLASQVD